MIYSLPSCKFTENHPQTSGRLSAWLSGRGVNVLGCCKASLGRFAAGDTVLFACLSCMLITEENSPSASVRSVWEYLLEQPDFPWPELNGERIAVQDCLRARDRPRLRAAVRECLRRSGAEVVELPARGETSCFDGTFLMNPIAPVTMNAAPKAFTGLSRFVEVLPPDEQTARMKAYAASLPDVRVAAYCNGCEAGLKRGGAKVVHLLELLCSRL